MATRAQVETLQKLNRGLIRYARADLNKLWAVLDLSKPAAARDRLLETVPVIAGRYGEIGAEVSAVWYEQLRTQAGARPGYVAQLADPVPVETIQRRVRFGAAHLFSENPVGTFDFVSGVLSKYVLQPGRETLIENTAADKGWGAGYARVPRGAHTCAFCLMLASRGPVYGSAEAAGEMNQFHDDCDCAVVPIGPGQVYPKGYDPDRLYEQYRAAADDARGGTSAVLAEMRRQLGVA